MNYFKNIFSFVTLVLLLSGTTFAQGQATVLGQIKASQIGGGSFNSELKDLGQGVKIVGSPMFKGEFTQGQVIFTGETVSEKTLLNYDSYENRLMFTDNGNYFEIPLDLVKGFYFLDADGNKKEAFLSGFSNRKEDIDKNTFLEVLYNGKVKLFNYHYTKFRRDEANIYNPRETVYYNSKSKYMILDSEGNLNPIKLREKDLMKVLSDRKDELKAFTYENDLNLGHVEDVKKLLSYYDTLNMK